MENMAKMITVGAVVLRNDVGEVLTVRKRGASLFQLPGGKPEAGESMLETVVRETAEEVGVELDPERLEYLGEFTAGAANEPGHQVTGTVFTYAESATSVTVDGPVESTEGQPAPHAEILELKWMDPVPFAEGFAPLLSTQVFPALAQ